MIKNQEGFIPLVILIGVVVAATIFGGGIFLSKQTLDTSPLQTVSVITEKNFENISDPLLRKHFVAWVNQKAYRIKSTSSQKKGSTIFDIVKNDPFYYRSIENDGTRDISETISFENTIYIKDYSDSYWWMQKMRLSNDEQNSNIKDGVSTDEFIARILSSSFQSLSIQPCENLTCYTYEQTDQADPQSKRVFLFDDKQFLLRKEELLFGEFKTTNEYSYPSFTIYPPSLTKDVPNGKSIYELSYGKNFINKNDVVNKTEAQVSQDSSKSEDSQVLDLTSNN